MTQRNGKTLKTLPDGAPRRMADGKNAFRKMTPAQRNEFLDWVMAEGGPAADRVLPEKALTLSNLLGDRA